MIYTCYLPLLTDMVAITGYTSIIIIIPLIHHCAPRYSFVYMWESLAFESTTTTEKYHGTAYECERRYYVDRL